MRDRTSTMRRSFPRVALCCLAAAWVLVACGRSDPVPSASASGPKGTGEDPMPYLDRIATGQTRWAASQATSAGVVVFGGASVGAEGSIRGASDVAVIEPDGSTISLAPLPDGPLFRIEASASPDGSTIYAAGVRCGSGSLDSDTGRASCRPGGLWLGKLDVGAGTWTAVAPPEDGPEGGDPSAVLLGTDAGLVLFTPETDGGPRAAWTASGDDDQWTRIDAPPFGWPCQAGGDAVSFNSEEPAPNLDEAQGSDDIPMVRITYQVAVLDERTGTWTTAEDEAVDAVTGSTSVGCTSRGLVALSRGDALDLASTFTTGQGWRTRPLAGEGGGRVVVADDTTLVLLTSASAPDLVFDPRSGDAHPLEGAGGAVIAHVLDDGTVIVLERGGRAVIRVLR